MEEPEENRCLKEGYMYLQKFCPKEAALCFNRALEISPGLTQALSGRGDSLMMDGRFDLALKDYETILRSERHPLIYMNKGLCLHQLGRSPEGLKCIEMAKKLCDDDRLMVIVISAKAEVHNDLGELSEALRDYYDAIALRKDDPSLYSFRGQLQYRMGRYQEAAQDISRAVALSNAFVPDLYCRAHCFWKLGDHHNALVDFNQVIEVEPNEWTNYLSRGRLLMEMGLNDAAMEDLTTTIKLNGACADAYALRAELYALKGDDRSIQRSALDLDKARHLQ